MRRIKKIWEGEVFSTFSRCSPGETLSDLQGTQHHDQKKRLWPHGHHTHHTRTCKVPNTMIRKKDTDHMIITALVLREWSKVEVPATPTSQTRCRVFRISPKYTHIWNWFWSSRTSWWSLPHPPYLLGLLAALQTQAQSRQASTPRHNWIGSGQISLIIWMWSDHDHF